MRDEEWDRESKHKKQQQNVQIPVERDKKDY